MELSKTVYAFVDTSSLDPMYNDYSKMEILFNNIKKQISNKKLVLFTHEIVIKEIENHMRKEFNIQLESYNKIKKSNQFVLLSNIKKYKKLFLSVENDKIINDAIKVFKDKIKKLGIIVIKTGSISIKNVLNKYFMVKPPFGEKNKKAEFPDAIMLESIIKTFNNIDNIHIISSDSDWERVCKEYNYTHHKSLSSLLNFINKEQQISNSINNFVRDKTSQNIINDIVSEKLKNIKFNVDGLEKDKKGYICGYEYDYVELMDLDIIGCKLEYIEDIEFGENEESKLNSTVIIKCNIKFNFECDYMAEEDSIWDSEEDKYIYVDSSRIIETHRINLYFRVFISGENNIPLNIDSVDFSKNIEEINFNHETLISKTNFEYNDYLEDFHFERKFKCPNCKNSIVVELISDGTECVYSEEKEMGLQNQYEIDVYGECPLCNCKYHITGELWEYPIGCYETDNNIKIEKEDDLKLYNEEETEDII